MAEQATAKWNVTLVDKDDDLYEIHQGQYGPHHDSVTKDYLYICNVHGEANAHLIATAPDLLHLFDDYPGYRAGQSTADYAARLGVWAVNNEKNVQAAISKAQGGTPVDRSS